MLTTLHNSAFTSSVYRSFYMELDDTRRQELMGGGFGFGFSLTRRLIDKQVIRPIRAHFSM
eukprot:c30060_g1_i1 orf=77-259(+)